MSESRVQFFNSQSSFGSSSVLSSSRLESLNEEIVYDTQQIFATLHNFLIPRSDLLDQGQFNNIIHRARILAKETIPDHLKHMPKNIRSNQYYQEGQKCIAKLEELIRNYDDYRSSRLQYEDFYKMYGAINFNKKAKPSEVNLLKIQPDVVNIVESVPLKVSKGMQRVFTQSNKYALQDKQIQQLQQQIIFLKKKQKAMATKYENDEEILRRQTQMRVNKILKMFQSNNESEIVKGLKEEIIRYQEEIKLQSNKNNEINKIVLELERKNSQLIQQNRILRDELESQRRMGNNNLVQELGDEDNKSILSQCDASGNELKKYQKKIKNLQYEVNLLRNELNKERQINYKLKKSGENEQINEVARLRKTLEVKTKQLQDKKVELDKEKISNIKLNDQLENSIKATQLVKLQSNKTPPTSANFGGSVGYSRSISDLSRLQISRLNKYSLSIYIGDGNEFYPYFDLLNKQFKIRFKRACLKQKQLLHKANGLEIGVISEFQQPNELKLHLHLSNFCDQKNIKNLKIKVTNAKNNKIQIEKNHIEMLEIGHQIKNSISLTIKGYPIGCTALVCEYEYYGKNQEVVALLPVHIFKMLTFKPRDDQFRSSSIIQIPIEKKVIKDIHILSSYFNRPSVQNNMIRLTILHHHTETKLLCDITLQKDNITIQYEHRSGEENITEYIAKSLCFLFRKEQII